VIRFVAALACAVAALTVPARARAFAPIPITVRAEDDVARHRWPLTVSVPFARGLLQRGQTVKVVDEHGGAHRCRRAAGDLAGRQRALAARYAGRRGRARTPRRVRRARRPL
jgi:hypothetical protein